MNHSQPYAKWLEIDISFMEVCHAVLRIPGKSKGADAEVKLAKKLGIPVFLSIENLNNNFKP